MAEHAHALVDGRTASVDVSPTVSVLGVAGLVPFVGLAVAALVLHGDEARRAAVAANLYGAVILSFLAGIWWGRLLAHRDGHEDSRRDLLALAMLPPLLGWAGAMLGPPAGGIVIALALVAVLGIERGQSDRLGAARSWQRLRFALTVVAAASLLVASFA